jgi:hypothetical protein
VQLMLCSSSTWMWQHLMARAAVNELLVLYCC